MFKTSAGLTSFLRLLQPPQQKIILFTGNFGEYRGEGIKIRPRFKYDKFNKLKYRDCVNELKEIH